MTSIEGLIVNIDGVKRGRVEIGDNGLIVGIAEATGKADIVLNDELIFPGFIDLHVHARECADHTWDYKEDFVSASNSAINGGVVAFADMPNNPTPPIDDASYGEKLKLTEKSAVEILLYAGTSPTSRPLQKSVPYKAYISKSVGELFFDSFAELEQFAQTYQGQNVSFHCEDPEILKANLHQTAHELKRPESAEVSAVDMALQIIEKYHLQGKICHASTPEAIEKINQARRRGVKVTVEVTPHHLFFDLSSLFDSASAEEKNSKSSSEVRLGRTKEDDQVSIINRRKMFQVNPPIRQSPETRQYLLRALKHGDIDFIATDHAPHSLAEKAKGTSGLTHLDTFGPFVTWLMQVHHFTPQEIARVCAYNPAKFFNQFSQNPYGQIASGFVGSLSIIDMNEPITITKDVLKTKAQWSPFEGVTFPGSVAYTIVKGKALKL